MPNLGLELKPLRSRVACSIDGASQAPCFEQFYTCLSGHICEGFLGHILQEQDCLLIRFSNYVGKKYLYTQNYMYLYYIFIVYIYICINVHLYRCTNVHKLYITCILVIYLCIMQITYINYVIPKVVANLHSYQQCTNDTAF